MDTKKDESVLNETEKNAMHELLEKHSFNLPKLGEESEGTVISIGKNEVLVDLGGFAHRYG